MAISAVNVTYSGQGPSATGQVFADGIQPGNASSNICFSGTATLDGAATTFAANFIDGTQTLSFTPTAVVISRSGKSTDTAAVSTTVQPSALTNVGFTVTISAAGSNGQLLSFAGQIVR